MRAARPPARGSAVAAMREAASHRSVARIPADVDRPDVLLARLTARQVVILAATGLAVWAMFIVLHTALPRVPSLYLIAPAAPVAAIAIALALGKREGLSADRFVLAALRHARAPKNLVPADAAGGGIGELPDFLPKKLRAATGPAPSPLEMPGQSIDPAGVIDLGASGHAAVAACGTVNFALRTDTEQDALVASFGQLLNSITGPIQLLVRTHRVDLTDGVARLREAAPSLPHPALEHAATEHADFLAELSARRDVLHRQVLLTAREPAPGRARRRRPVADAAAGSRLGRRLEEAGRSLAGAQIPVRAFDAAALRILLADAATALDAPHTEGEIEQ